METIKSTFAIKPFWTKGYLQALTKPQMEHRMEHKYLKNPPNEF
jgi:hypothetical protein